MNLYEIFFYCPNLETIVIKFGGEIEAEVDWMVPDDFPEQSHRNLKSLKCNDRQSIHPCAEKLLRDMSTEIIVKEYQGATP